MHKVDSGSAAERPVVELGPPEFVKSYNVVKKAKLQITGITQNPKFWVVKFSSGIDIYCKGENLTCIHKRLPYYFSFPCQYFKELWEMSKHQTFAFSL